MEQEVKVVIPSKGRAASMTTHKYVSNAIVCIAESEYETYRDYHPTVEIVTHPDSVVGLMRKREWIYEKFGDVFMFDDDLKGFSRMTQKQREDSKVSPDLAYWIIQNCANMARLTGCYLFSFNKLKRPEFYSGHNPFTLTGCINGCAFGILKGADKLVMDHRITMGYEFYISGLNAFHYRKAFFDNRYCINQDTFGHNIGGASNIRTLDNERNDLNILIESFGSAIVERAKGPKAVKCEFSKYLKIPF